MDTCIISRKIIKIELERYAPNSDSAFSKYILTIYFPLMDMDDWIIRALCC